MSIDPFDFDEGFIIVDEDEDERTRKYFEENPDEDFLPDDNEWFGFRGGDWDEE